MQDIFLDISIQKNIWQSNLIKNFRLSKNTGNIFQPLYIPKNVMFDSRHED